MTVIDCVRGFNSWMIPQLRTAVQHRLCSMSHCRPVLISNKTQTCLSVWWDGGLNAHTALSNDCPILCSLTVISDVSNIQTQSSEVADPTLLPLHLDESVALETGISEAKQKTLENILFYSHFHLFAMEIFHNPEITTPSGF